MAVVLSTRCMHILNYYSYSATSKFATVMAIIISTIAFFVEFNVYVCMISLLCGMYYKLKTCVLLFCFYTDQRLCHLSYIFAKHYFHIFEICANLVTVTSLFKHDVYRELTFFQWCPQINVLLCFCLRIKICLIFQMKILINRMFVFSTISIVNLISWLTFNRCLLGNYIAN